MEMSEFVERHAFRQQDCLGNAALGNALGTTGKRQDPIVLQLNQILLGNTADSWETGDAHSQTTFDNSDLHRHEDRNKNFQD